MTIETLVLAFFLQTCCFFQWKLEEEDKYQLKRDNCPTRDVKWPMRLREN